jgi:hypothetical protein
VTTPVTTHASPERALGEALLAELRERFRQQRTLAERAAAQVDDAAFFATLDEESNSIAVVMQHMGGNLRSRFTDFLTTDGEKPDRQRDAEFERTDGTTREDVMARWSAGWGALERTLDLLGPDDLLRTVTIRGEPMPVIQALGRALAHQAQHAGQVVLLAKHRAGAGWTTLSIARGQSTAYAPAATGGQPPERRA